MSQVVGRLGRWARRESLSLRYALRLKDSFTKDDVPGLAAELAFRTLMALFPFFIFLAALSAFISDVAGVDDPTGEALSYLDDHLPADAANLLSTQVGEVINSSNVGLASIGILAALWAASGGVNAMIKAMNRAYNVEEGRPVWRRYALAIGATLGSGLLIFVAVTVMLAGQVVGARLAREAGLGGAFAELVSLARLPLVFLVLFGATAVLYRSAPNIALTWRSVLPGAAVFAVVWVLATALFALYVANFGSYNATYGALGGAIVLLLWLYLSSIVLLLGAEVNAVIAQWDQLEAQDSAPATLEGST